MRGIDADHPLDLEAENARLENASPEERLKFAVDKFGEKLLFTSSFGAGSGVLLHMWSIIAPKLPVVFIDTGFLFDETHAYKETLAKSLGITIRTVSPTIPRAEFMKVNGDDIQKRDADFCCAENKVAPLAPLLNDARAWVSGLRRDQSGARKDTPILLAQDDGPLKVHPLATMTAEDVADYMKRNNVPEHPLLARRYLSIGCTPCTRAIADGEDERAGRWAGSEKTECGLHEWNKKRAESSR
jgi:phosphoadenosine phosphosulfate reductase